MHYWASGVKWVTGVNECKNKILYTYAFLSITMSPAIIKQSRITHKDTIVWFYMLVKDALYPDGQKMHKFWIFIMKNWIIYPSFTPTLESWKSL